MSLIVERTHSVLVRAVLQTNMKRNVDCFTRASSNGDPAGLRAVRDLREKADGREQLGHGLGLEVVVVDAVEHNVHHVHQEVNQVGSVALNQQLDLKNERDRSGHLELLNLSSSTYFIGRIKSKSTKSKGQTKANKRRCLIKTIFCIFT